MKNLKKNTASLYCHVISQIKSVSFPYLTKEFNRRYRKLQIRVSWEDRVIRIM